MQNKIKQLFVLSACAFFLACGDSSNERGIASTTTDSTASGSAYNSNDGFAPAAVPVTPQSPATSVVAPAVPADSAASKVVTAPGTSTSAATAAAPATAATTKAAAKPAAADNSADIKKGEALISKSDCLACHKVDGKLVGPSYKEVAAKYPNNASTISQLVSKIKKGGSGVWGAVPMSPHPALSDADGKAMVMYILSLK